jgi:flavoprotein
VPEGDDPALGTSATLNDPLVTGAVAAAAAKTTVPSEAVKVDFEEITIWPEGSDPSGR